MAVLTGDIQTDNDARRLARFGFPVRQITTGGACHLDAGMVERALADWRVEDLEILFLENVGNLVCPTSYDLGEDARAVVLSVTEGEDKPLKYPATFHHADLMVLNKIDLLPYVPFQLDLARENARRVQPAIEILEVSCTTRRRARPLARLAGRPPMTGSPILNAPDFHQPRHRGLPDRLRDRGRTAALRPVEGDRATSAMWPRPFSPERWRWAWLDHRRDDALILSAPPSASHHGTAFAPVLFYQSLLAPVFQPRPSLPPQTRLV